MRTYKIVHFFLCLIALIGWQPLSAASHDETIVKQHLLQYFKKYHQQEHFTAMSAAVHLPATKLAKDRILISHFGSKTLPPPSNPLQSHDLYEIGSITKSFIAVILLQLESEGKLNLNQPLGTWLPQYKAWRKMPLRRLLNMTSNIPSYTLNASWDALLFKKPQYFWTEENLLHYAKPHQSVALNKIAYNYSNSNYVLAGMVIEKVTNRTLNQNLEDRIFKPFHLNNTFYLPGLSKTAQQNLMPRLIQGYTFDESTKKLTALNHNLSWAGAAGGIVADINDVVHYIKYLYEGRFFAENLRKKSLQALETFVSMKTGQPLKTVDKKNPLGFGLGIGYFYDPSLNTKFYVYEGSTIGFRVVYIYNPNNHVFVVVALNSKAGEGNPHSIQGDHAKQFSLDLYASIMKVHP